LHNKLEKILYKCTKPSRYSGGEFLSANKDFDKAQMRMAFAFPDKYEIGISNFGLRILYDMVNKVPEFMADRVYAPENDFRALLKENKLPLFALESRKPLKDFDFIGFSLQYELAYPTILAMLEDSGIAIKNVERAENDPIIIAGGPGAFNPSPLAPFIDVFLIGDGEELILNILNVSKGKTRAQRLQEISKLEGAYVSEIHKNKVIKKQIVNLTKENHPLAYPIPYSQCVHDRAVIELRRGCSRLCRFCQSAHTNLPVRERNAEDIIEITKTSVKNTGYDEYSLLSLSSNDYTNIEYVVERLNKHFYDQKVSISLPSQRADKFNLKLAQLIKNVRKTSVTLAPEAGSQRLRNVINKNLTKEQIINSALSCYQEGWRKIKFYFMIGLPTETYDDLDEMIELLKEIKSLAKGLEITCSTSVFVPKPHTPFQWFGQNSVEEVFKKMYYLKDAAKKVKGVKINVHEPYISQIEAVLTRGDKDISRLIEKVYQKGAYLHSWDEDFSYKIWQESAQELGLDLNELSTRNYPIEAEMPWDFISTGISKEWLQDGYTKALQQELTIGCEEKCSACGVCANLKTKKIMDVPIEESQQ